MDGTDFLKRWLKMQYQIGYDQAFKIATTLIIYSSLDPSEFSNLAFVDTPITQEDLEEAEEKLNALKRKPAFFIENSKRFTRVISLLKTNNYSKKWEDSWMFYTENNIDPSRFSSVKTVERERMN